MQQLTGLDQMFLSLETDTTDSQIGCLLLFTRPAEGQPLPDEAFMRNRLQERLPYIPPLHRKYLKSPLGLDYGYLAIDDRIDVTKHLSTIRLPSPGTKEQLVAEINRMMGIPLPVDDGPMWQYTVIEGLEDGGIAHFLRIHHLVIDGSSVPVLWNLLSDHPREPLLAPERTANVVEPVMGKAEMVARELLNTAQKPFRMAALQAEMLHWVKRRYPEEGLLFPVALAARMMPSALGRTVASVVNLRQRAAGKGEVAPYFPVVRAPDTPFAGKQGTQRTFWYNEMPLADLKEVGKANGATLNDVVNAVAAGAVRRYLDRRGVLTDKPLIINCPVSLRGEVDSTHKERWANHVFMMFALFPTHLADPLERLAFARKEFASAKSNWDAMPVEMMRDMSRYMPAEIMMALMGTLAKLPGKMQRIWWNVVISNVKGPREPDFFNGLEATANVPASFMSVGGGLNITLQSYGEKVWFGYLGAPEQVGNLAPFADDMVAELEELKRATRQAQSARATGSGTPRQPGRPRSTDPSARARHAETNQLEADTELPAVGSP